MLEVTELQYTVTTEDRVRASTAIAHNSEDTGSPDRQEAPELVRSA